MSSLNLLEFKSISKYYNQNVVVDKVNFTIKLGTLTVLIGPNGAGKTTLARLLLGIDNPDMGSIVKYRAIKYSYVPQSLTLNYNLPITTSEFLDYVSPLWLKGDQEILDFANMESVKNSQLYTLSGGQLQKILIMASLLQHSNLIVLDEPTQGLDVHSQNQFYALLDRIKSNKNTSIFIISHDLHTLVPNADQVLCINKHICCSKSYCDSAANIGIYIHNHDHTHN